MKWNKLAVTVALSAACFFSSFAGNTITAEAARIEKPEVIKAQKEVKEAEIADYSAVFNADYYYNRYPDLQVTIGKDAKALLEHFVDFGMKEGRVGNAAFDVKAYMKNNPDLVGLLKAEDLTLYYKHFANFGAKEGRIALYQEGQAPKEGVLGTHTTYYDVKESRAINVELAASRINGIVVKPGKSFSYSNAVGTRTIENGYVDGPSFANGKEVSSIGGGICQVSTNLYAAMLFAGITPTEHHYHGLPVDYAPTGLDAAIAENYLDLCFKNNFKHDVVIEAIAKDGVLTVSLLRGTK